MYEDSWHSFVPTSNASNQKLGESSTLSDHRRRESLLQQPTANGFADTERVDRVSGPLDAPTRPISPPKATVLQRANSYSAFYDAAIAQLNKDKPKAPDSHRDQNVIDNDLKFLAWHGKVEGRLSAAADAEYEQHYDNLILTQSHMDSLLDMTNSNLDRLADLAKSFAAVETQTTAFRARCEGLLTDQKRISKISKDLEDNLQFYSYLEPISRRLNAPNAGNTVRSREFSEMLATLDHCLRYVHSHSGHNEAESYRSRYRLLMTRALTLIRNHFVSSLRDVTGDVQKRIADRQLNDTTMSTLLYAKFRVGAPELKTIGKEIQKRAMLEEGAGSGSEAEYQSLMNELYQAYSAARTRLVLPVLRKKVADIAITPSTSKDLVAFARSAIGYFRGICLDEFQLWEEWFEGNDSLYDFLESICDSLYDHLKPRIIHETQILKLCELCTLLQTRYMRDEDDEQESIVPGQLDFSSLVIPILEDAQTRLVFRAQTVLRDDIERFKPKPELINSLIKGSSTVTSNGKSTGPVTSGKRNSRMSVPSTPIPKTPRIVDEAGDDDDTRDARWGFDSEAAHHGWYPTLRKAIWLLSRIYRLVNSAVFDDLAHQIVHQTNMSLHQASLLISSKAQPIDGHLFLIRHLLLLKSQIVAFDIEFVTPEVSFDFSGVTNTFWELRERGGLFNPANLVRLVGSGLIPRVVENMLDAKAELDGRLRTVINDFTTSSAANMTDSISPGVLNRKGFDVSKVLPKLQLSLQEGLDPLRQKLNAYLDDIRTKETLMAAVQDQVIQNYELFYDHYVEISRLKGKMISRKGKNREEGVWDVDTFADWVAAVSESVHTGKGGRTRSGSQA
ncbi:MAG: Golgi transport complex subunit 3 [Vezdaea aestivalis]|nr:MAG: Golgi transport complex subunit 3 [Vezdaea aestivalis]